MAWNYRVFKEYRDLGDRGYDLFKIIEVFYNEDGKTINGWSDDSESVLIWDDYDDLKGTAEMVQAAFKKPTLVLKGDTLVEIE